MSIPFLSNVSLVSNFISFFQIFILTILLEPVTSPVMLTKAAKLDIIME